MDSDRDYERVMEIVRLGGQPTSEDLVWISRYLDLADKYLALTDNSADKNDANSAPTRPKAKKQSA
ncbi:MAG TPA: hypothetical protein VK699_17225 [Terriglobales bacterium]|jgi:hypothetical protein|nr:hypothetical protein [Terriglobales bacterium]